MTTTLRQENVGDKESTGQRRRAAPHLKSYLDALEAARLEKIRVNGPEGDLATMTRVFRAIMPLLSTEEYRPVCQVDMANYLRLPRSNVNRAIRRWVRIGSLLAGSREGIHRTYKLPLTE